MDHSSHVHVTQMHDHHEHMGHGSGTPEYHVVTDSSMHDHSMHDHSMHDHAGHDMGSLDHSGHDMGSIDHSGHVLGHGGHHDHVREQKDVYDVFILV